MRVLVTGAAGFVGTALVARTARDGRFEVRGVGRRPGPGVGTICDVTAGTDWRAALVGVDVVVHLAARVHVMHETAGDPLTEFRRVNVDGTLNVARQAVAAGVRRFVFLSTLKVNGESGVFTELDPPAPEDAYAISKLEAEHGLRQISAATGLEVVVIRPPLVYGPGVAANFRSLMRAVARGIPLPLGAVDNRRSLVAVDNLVDFILTCVEHPAAANETFFVSDGEDISTSELIRRIARAMNRPARLIPVTPSVLMLGATLVGRRDVARRLLGSLQVDISKARRLLSWAPPVSVDDALRRAAEGS